MVLFTWENFLEQMLLLKNMVNIDLIVEEQKILSKKSMLLVTLDIQILFYIWELAFMKGNI